MKGIVTLRNSDKTYDTAGMNNRTITQELKTTQGIRDRAFLFAATRRRDAVKIEYFPSGRLYSFPSCVEEWELIGTSWTQKQRLVRK